jgi:hypothetical protein
LAAWAGTTSNPPFSVDDFPLATEKWNMKIQTDGTISHCRSVKTSFEIIWEKTLALVRFYFWYPAAIAQWKNNWVVISSFRVQNQILAKR